MATAAISRRRRHRGVPDFRFDEALLRRFHEDDVAPALRALLACDIPVIAQIEGACIGGGLEIAACCDIRIAAQQPLRHPDRQAGLSAGAARAEMVARVLPLRLLRELLLEARLLGATEAHEHGVVNRVVEDDEVAAEVQRTAERIAALSPQAMRLNKITLRQLARGGISDAERLAHYTYADSAEHREGLAAFIDKRPARFNT
jgi:enoyl-CoA hydratase